MDAGYIEGGGNMGTMEGREGQLSVQLMVARQKSWPTVAISCLLSPRKAKHLNLHVTFSKVLRLATTPNYSRTP